MKDHLNILGFKAKDKVTQFEGVVSSVSFDLYGCVQAVLSPPINEKKEVPDGRWFDTSRLEILSDAPVMKVPNYDKFESMKVPGGQQLPAK